MTSPDRIPVIVGVGEVTDRPASSAEAREPIDLMVDALRAAEKDASAILLTQLESIDLVGLVSWKYADPVSLLAQKLGVKPLRLTNASMGGETPIRLIHDAAVLIAKGELSAAAIVGAEATSSRNRARKEKASLNWTPQAAPEDAVVFPSSRYRMNAQAKALGMMDPAQVYPLYEMAFQHSQGQDPDQANEESAALWARYAAVAASNDKAWIKSAPTADIIAEVTPDNRLINWPYRKLMVANPSVNQSAAIIVTSLKLARESGVPEDRLVYIHGGAAAQEAEDYLLRDSYARSAAQDAVLKKAVEVAGGNARKLTAMELYSCFPVVPKMALKTLGDDVTHLEPTVAGGLTFFGGPLNNYMSHAVCAMVRRIRSSEGGLGLVYGQGGYVNKHHALIVARAPLENDLELEYSVQNQADKTRGPQPDILEGYVGPAAIETYTVRFARDGTPLEGVVIARSENGGRLMARVPVSDEQTLQRLLSRNASAIGVTGYVRTDAFGKYVFQQGEERESTLKFATVEREGPLTIVTINRPDAMNALHPEANAELATIFDAFAADPEQWVAILTGAGGKAFSSGNDLKWTSTAMMRGQEIETPVTGFAGLTARFDLDKPVIAAVEGVAMGGGFEIALACDLIIAGEGASFALPEPRVGLAALAGGLLRLPRQIGQKQAMGMILTGRRVPASEGKSLGFVNEVVADGQALTEAKRWAGMMLECSPMSLRASKQVLQRGLDMTVEQATTEQSRYPAVKALFRSEDVREGPMAFAQKRKPEWKGR